MIGEPLRAAESLLLADVPHEEDASASACAFAVANASAISSTLTVPEPSSSAPLKMESCRAGCTLRMLSSKAVKRACWASVSLPGAGLSAPCWPGFFRQALTRPDIEVVGIAEPDATLSRRYAEQFHIDPKLFFTSADQMLDPLQAGSGRPIYQHLRTSGRCRGLRQTKNRRHDGKAPGGQQ